MDLFSTLVMVLGYVLGAVALLLAALCYYMNCNFGYWEKRRVPHLQPELFFGNTKEFILCRKSLGEVYQSIYTQFEGHRFVGAYQSRTPYLVLRDPELIKTILVKDFNHFQHRGMTFDERRDPLSAHLFNLGGHKWRWLRTKLTPTFTSGKMKMMFQSIQDCTAQLDKYLEVAAEKQKALDIRDATARFTTDVIGSIAFGIQMNSMSGKESEFRRVGREAFQPSVWNTAKRHMSMVVPAIARIFLIKMVREKAGKFFKQAVTDTIEYREKNNVKRNDFLQLLIQMRKGKIEEEYDPLINDSALKGMQNGNTVNGHIDNGNSMNGSVRNGTLKSKEEVNFELTDDLMAAQAIVFFLAGFETSSTTMGYVLLELAMNQDIQETLREEIDSVLERHDGKVTYEAVQEMQYLDRVISETLRLNPPAQGLGRQCTKDYKIPGTDIVLEKGCRVHVPVYALQRDPKYFPEPDRFDPDRFTEENKRQRPAFSYVPFGEGPRLCIGMRFGVLQAKVGLVAMLRKCEFHPCERTHYPVVFNPRSFVASPKHGIILQVKLRH